jgi:hypothetical protein
VIQFRQQPITDTTLCLGLVFRLSPPQDIVTSLLVGPKVRIARVIRVVRASGVKGIVCSSRIVGIAGIVRIIRIKRTIRIVGTGTARRQVRLCLNRIGSNYLFTQPFRGLFGDKGFDPELEIFAAVTSFDHVGEISRL